VSGAPRALLGRLPGPLGRLASAGHGGAALLLVRHWGGTKRYVALRPPPGGSLAQLIGLAAAEALAGILTADGVSRHLDIPSRSSLTAALKGAILDHPGTTRETASALGCTERYVRLVRSGAGWQPRRRARAVDERQISIFDLLDG
jgi:hypothetical protein